ncbi:MAG TPA: DUF3881 family protein [Candidatus Cottocaccamicrobium excrementipullorum]|nr:DUF3881 family protein [Candidatus Cottocaccamicrobium excrementipullorum]
MHKFLRAAGFRGCKTRREEEELLSVLMNHKIETGRLELPEGTTYVEYHSELAPGIGVRMAGEETAEGEFHLDYYFPYLNGDFASSKEECTIERHAEKETYAGMLDEYKVGISLIFYVSNSMEYRIRRQNHLSLDSESVNLSAWSVDGKILLPIQKTARQIELAKVASINRNSLLEAAKHGDEDAMETLTIEDIDLYSKISRRIRKEDVYSIIESCFMPWGIECDQYAIVGEIKEVRSLTNFITGEEIYNLTIECNDIMFNVGINQADLLGEPAPGRRFKGQIWMTGKVNFRD